MTDEQKTKLVALKDAWLAVLEKYRRAESVPERDAVITEFVKRHIAETGNTIGDKKPFGQFACCVSSDPKWMRTRRNPSLPTARR
jgi:hypothetical protein